MSDRVKKLRELLERAGAARVIPVATRNRMGRYDLVAVLSGLEVGPDLSDTEAEFYAKAINALLPLMGVAEAANDLIRKLEQPGEDAQDEWDALFVAQARLEAE